MSTADAAATGAGPARWWWRLLLTASVGAGVLVALLLRPDGARPWRVMWAEDATRFLMAGRTDPSPGGWLAVYAGYRHLVPHQIGALAGTVPLADAPVVFAVAGALVDLACLALLATGLRRWLPRWWMPPLAVLALTMPVATCGDVADGAVNLHYFGRLGLLGLALLRPWTRVGTVLAAVAALALGLSEPLVLLILPIAAIDAVLWWRDSRRQGTADGGGDGQGGDGHGGDGHGGDGHGGDGRVPAEATGGTGGWIRRSAVLLAMAVAGAVQGVTALTHPRWTAPPTDPIPDPVGLYRQFVLAKGLFPDPLRGHRGLTGIAAVVLALVLFSAAAVFAERRAGVFRIIAGVALAGYGAAFLVVDSRYNHAYGPRYSLIPAALLVAGLVVLAAGDHLLQRALFLGLVAATVAGGVLNWSVHGHRGLGPEWGPGVAAAQQECRANPAPGALASIPAAPKEFRPLRLPCSWLVP